MKKRFLKPLLLLCIMVAMFSIVSVTASANTTTFGSDDYMYLSGTSSADDDYRYMLIEWNTDDSVDSATIDSNIRNSGIQIAFPSESIVAAVKNNGWDTYEIDGNTMLTLYFTPYILENVNKQATYVVKVSDAPVFAELFSDIGTARTFGGSVRFYYCDASGNKTSGELYGRALNIGQNKSGYPSSDMFTPSNVYYPLESLNVDLATDNTFYLPKKSAETIPLAVTGLAKDGFDASMQFEHVNGGDDNVGLTYMNYITKATVTDVDGKSIEGVEIISSNGNPAITIPTDIYDKISTTNLTLKVTFWANTYFIMDDSIASGASEKSATFEVTIYRPTVYISTDLTNIKATYEEDSLYREDITVTLTAKKGYVLPSSITVTRGYAEVLDPATYTYRPSIGVFQINGKYVTDNIKITASGHAHEYNPVISDLFKKSDASCSSSAVYYYSCSCGQTNDTTFTSGDALRHDYTYVSNNNTIIETCVNGCSHEETAALRAPTDLSYNGEKKECTVEYSGNWQGGELEVIYETDSTSAGEHIACIRKNSMSSNVSYTITKALYTVSFVADGNGSISSSGGVYDEGDIITVKATADEGYRFIGWYLGDTLLTADSILQISVYVNEEYVAKFDVDSSGEPDEPITPDEPAEPSSFDFDSIRTGNGENITVDHENKKITVNVPEGDNLVLYVHQKDVIPGGQIRMNNYNDFKVTYDASGVYRIYTINNATVTVSAKVMIDGVSEFYDLQVDYGIIKSKFNFGEIKCDNGEKFEIDHEAQTIRIYAEKGAEYITLYKEQNAFADGKLVLTSFMGNRVKSNQADGTYKVCFVKNKEVSVKGVITIGGVEKEYTIISVFSPGWSFDTLKAENASVAVIDHTAKTVTMNATSDSVQLFIDQTELKGNAQVWMKSYNSNKVKYNADNRTYTITKGKDDSLTVAVKVTIYGETRYYDLILNF